MRLVTRGDLDGLTSAVIITLAHAWAAFAILPLYVSLEKIDKSLLEAATDLGDGPVARFLRVTLPLSLPGVISASLLIFIPTTGDYITPGDLSSRLSDRKYSSISARYSGSTDGSPSRNSRSRSSPARLILRVSSNRLARSARVAWSRASSSASR